VLKHLWLLPSLFRTSVQLIIVTTVHSHLFSNNAVQSVVQMVSSGLSDGQDNGVEEVEAWPV